MLVRWIKATGRSNKITITNDKGRLSQADIDKMVKDAEMFAEDDKKVKDRIDAKNQLESFVYSMRQNLKDDKITSKLPNEEKKELSTLVEEVIAWLDKNQTAEKEEYEHKKSELESKVSPIFSKMYEQHPSHNSYPTNNYDTSSNMDSNSGPKIEQVD